MCYNTTVTNVLSIRIDIKEERSMVLPVILMPKEVERNSTTEVYIFDVWNYNIIQEIYVEGYKSGVVLIDPPAGTNIVEFCEFLEGIFLPQSNFIESVCEVYHVSTDTFRGVKSVFNDIPILVSKNTANAKYLYSKWNTEMKKHLKNKKKS